MLDIKLIRSDINTINTALAKRGITLDVAQWEQWELQRRDIQGVTEALQAQRNQGAKEVGNLKKAGQDASELMAQMQQVNEQLAIAEVTLAQLQNDMEAVLLSTPNTPHDSVPQGKDEHDNVQVRTVGSPRVFDFEVLDHTDIGERRGWLDVDAATKITGSRFSVLKGSMARLQRALTQFMLDKHTLQHGYTEVYVPYLVNSESLLGTGQLPKFEEDLFKMQGDKAFYLIPTAEVPVTNLVRDVLLDEKQLPLCYVAHTPCFRSEAGSYGRDTRGLIRQHQFEKVELVQIVKAEDSDAALETLTGHAEAILQDLELPYRVMLLCGGDMGFSSTKTYDIEVWLPSQQQYREISSCSNMGDYQARRLKARYKDSAKKNQLVHTLNGSGLAVGRTLLALLENHQQADGSISIPKALQPYMGGATSI